ncbi:hypothetical protein L0222_31810 [bacterium]|nr:hypothetical protein [bacterium]MCI0603008.1 hypothetical protein [bacterium]
MKILIAAMITPFPYPSPGMLLHRMQYVQGLRRLGHEVYLVEEVEPDWCVDMNGLPCDFEHTVRRQLFADVVRQYELQDHSCQIYNHGEDTFGLSLSSVKDLAGQTDLLLNWSGHLKTEWILDRVKRRVYIDQDPVFTQLWVAEYGKDLNFKNHDAFLSVGLNIGTGRTNIPDCGVKWNPLLPPVVLEDWRFEIDPSPNAFTTIASWSGYGDVSFDGEWFSSKWQEFKRFAELPVLSKQPFEVVLKDFSPEDEGIQLLKSSGWILKNGGEIKDVSGYLSYIRRSRAEIGIAQNAYVKANSGWFSDRWSHYLASGKPVLAQSTGFEDSLSADAGMLSFRNMEEAIQGIDSINSNYAGHCEAARDFAETYLDYKKTLPAMLQSCYSS